MVSPLRKRADTRLPHVQVRPRPAPHGLARNDRRDRSSDVSATSACSSTWWDQTGLVSLLVIPEFIWRKMLPRHLLRDLGVQEGLANPSPNLARRQQLPDTLPPSWQRLLALSGVAFAALLSFSRGSRAVANTPDYGATDQDWTTWADDNQWKSRIGAFLILLAQALVSVRAGGNRPSRCACIRIDLDQVCDHALLALGDKAKRDQRSIRSHSPVGEDLPCVGDSSGGLEGALAREASIVGGGMRSFVPAMTTFSLPPETIDRP